MEVFPFRFQLLRTHTTDKKKNQPRSFVQDKRKSFGILAPDAVFAMDPPAPTVAKTRDEIVRHVILVRNGSEGGSALPSMPSFFTLPPSKTPGYRDDGAADASRQMMSSYASSPPPSERAQERNLHVRDDA